MIRRGSRTTTALAVAFALMVILAYGPATATASTTPGYGTVVESAEDGDLSEWFGDTDEFAANGEFRYDGLYGIEGEDDDSGGANLLSMPGDGLGDYPEPGDTFTYFMCQLDDRNAAKNEDNTVFFGIQNYDSNSYYPDDGYGFMVDRADSRLVIKKWDGGTQTYLNQTGLQGAGDLGHTLRVDIKWNAPEINVTIRDLEDGSVGRINASDPTFSSKGGVGLHTDGENRFWDYFGIDPQSSNSKSNTNCADRNSGYQTIEDFEAASPLSDWNTEPGITTGSGLNSTSTALLGDNSQVQSKPVANTTFQDVIETEESLSWYTKYDNSDALSFRTRIENSNGDYYSLYIDPLGTTIEVYEYYNNVQYTKVSKSFDNNKYANTELFVEFEYINDTEFVLQLYDGSDWINSVSWTGNVTGPFETFEVNPDLQESTSQDDDIRWDEIGFTSLQISTQGNSVSGTVNDTNGNAVGGATVELSQSGSTVATNTTDATGNYSFSGVADGTYNVTVSDPWHQNETKSITVSGSDVTQDFSLTPVYRLNGTVTNSTGGPVAGASVKVDGGVGGVTKTNSTDSGGRYAVTVPADDYTVAVTASGYQTKGVNVTVSSNTTRDIQLEASQPPRVVSAAPTTYRRNRSVSLEAKVADANGDPIEAKIIYRNRSNQWEVVSQTVFTSGTKSGRYITAQIQAKPGENRWYVYTEDPGSSQNSNIFDFRTPGYLTYYNASTLLTPVAQARVEIVSRDSNYRDVRYGGSTDPVSLEGVPDETLVARVNVSGFFEGSIVIDDPAKNQTVLLYPKNDSESNTSTDEQAFTLDDQTGGKFPPSETYLLVEAYYLGQWRHVGSGSFGATNRVTLPLRAGETYRLIVKNPTQNVKRNLGTITYDPATYPDPATLTVSTVDKPTDENEPPAARYDYSPNAVSTNDTVTFDAINSSDSDGQVVDYAWDFDGDGTTDATGAVVTHRYRSGGNYSPTLTVTDDDGATSTTTRTIYVAGTAEPPIANWTTNESAPYKGIDIELNASNSTDPDRSISGYNWLIETPGGGSFDINTSNPTANLSLTQSGNYTITLTVQDLDGLTDSLARTIYVAGSQADANEVPSASFTQNVSNPDAGDDVQFDGSGSTDPDGSIASYGWDFDDDGKFDDGSGTTATTSFARNGTYQVSLRVTDNNGSQATATVTVTVGAGEPSAPPDEAPQAAIDYAPANPAPQKTVVFNASNSTDPNGSIASYEWDLDEDGQYDDAVGVEATQQFPDAGTHQVAVRVTDDVGQTDVATVQVVIVDDSNVQGEPAVVSFDPSVRSLPATDNVSVTVTIDNQTTTLRNYSVQVILDNGSTTTTLRWVNGTNPTGEQFVFDLNLTDEAGGQLRVIAIADGANGVRVNRTASYQIREFFGTQYSLLGTLDYVETLIPAHNWEQFSTVVALLVTVLGTVAVGASVRMSTELLGVTALGFMVGFQTIGWLGFEVLFVAAAAWVAFAAVRRGL